MKAMINCITGWIPVQRSVKIAFDLETVPLRIKTDSTIGSKDYVWVHLYTAEEQYVGCVYFDFGSPQKYRINPCTNEVSFPTAPQSEVNKIWRISKLPGPRITIHCNGVKVLDIEMSDSQCRDGSDWSSSWSEDIEKILFVSSDKASDYYSFFPGNLLYKNFA